MSSKSKALKTAKNPADSPEMVTVPANAEQVVCDGGHPALGHPKTYYSFDGADFIDCGYCDRRFVKGKTR